MGVCVLAVIWLSGLAASPLDGLGLYVSLAKFYGVLVDLSLSSLLPLTRALCVLELGFGTVRLADVVHTLSESPVHVSGALLFYLTLSKGARAPA